MSFLCYNSLDLLYSITMEGFMSDNLKEKFNKFLKDIVALSKQGLEKIKILLALAVFKIAKLFGNKDAKQKDAHIKSTGNNASNKKSASASIISSKIVTNAKKKWTPIDGTKSIFVPANSTNNVSLSVLASVSKAFIILIFFCNCSRNWYCYGYC